jgi:hypothetical protein
MVCSFIFHLRPLYIFVMILIHPDSDFCKSGSGTVAMSDPGQIYVPNSGSRQESMTKADAKSCAVLRFQNWIQEKLMFVRADWQLRPVRGI